MSTNIIFVRVIRTVYQPSFLMKNNFQLKASGSKKATVQTLTGVFPRWYSKRPPPFWFRSNLKGAWQPSRINWPSRKLSGTFDSDIKDISIKPLTISVSRPNLCLRNLYLNVPKYQFTNIAVTNMFEFEYLFTYWVESQQTVDTSSKKVSCLTDSENQFFFKIVFFC